MKRKRFSEEQIIGVLKEHEAGMKTARRLRALEGESAKLKKLLAEAHLDNATLKDLLTKNGDARGEAGSRVSSAWRAPDERAAGVPRAWLPAHDGALLRPAA